MLYPRNSFFHIINVESGKVLYLPRPTTSGATPKVKGDVYDTTLWWVTFVSATEMCIRPWPHGDEDSDNIKVWIHISRDQQKVEVVYKKNWTCKYRQVDDYFEITDSQTKFRMAYDAATNSIIAQPTTISLTDSGKWRLETTASPYLLRNFSRFWELQPNREVGDRYHIIHQDTGKVLYLPKQSGPGAKLQLANKVNAGTEWIVNFENDGASIKTAHKPHLVLHISRARIRAEASDEQRLTCKLLAAAVPNTTPPEYLIGDYFLILDPQKKLRMLVDNMNNVKVDGSGTTADSRSLWRIETPASAYICTHFQDY
ncbi:hypothetical protein B0H19DRAFT_1194556 [Mycena capillaripes]|nr:hypothetical protein B0H19DRAFT_1194556 [Mycena capillaripes]